MPLTRENAPWYTDSELLTLNTVAQELAGDDRSDAAATGLVHLAWFPGATVDQLRRAVAAHRAPLAGEPPEPEWQ